MTDLAVLVTYKSFEFFLYFDWTQLSRNQAPTSQKCHQHDDLEKMLRNVKTSYLWTRTSGPGGLGRFIPDEVWNGDGPRPTGTIFDNLRMKAETKPVFKN